MITCEFGRPLFPENTLGVRLEIHMLQDDCEVPWSWGCLLTASVSLLVLGWPQAVPLLFVALCVGLAHYGGNSLAVSHLSWWGLPTGSPSSHDAVSRIAPIVVRIGRRIRRLPGLLFGGSVFGGLVGLGVAAACVAPELGNFWGRHLFGAILACVMSLSIFIPLGRLLVAFHHTLQVRRDARELGEALLRTALAASPEAAECALTRAAFGWPQPPPSL